MNNCAGSLSECVNALQEILENLIKIQQDIITGPKCNNKDNNKDSCDCDNLEPIEGADCKEFNKDNIDKPWFCLPPAKSQIDDEECISPDESSQNDDDDECADENESLGSGILEPSDECTNKLDKNQNSSDGYQRIIAVRENADGSVSKIYALRKNIRPPKLPNRSSTTKPLDLDCLNDIPNAESTRVKYSSGLCHDGNNDKNSLQSFRYKNKEKTNCEFPSSKQQQPQQIRKSFECQPSPPKSRQNLSKSSILGQNNPICSSSSPSMGGKNIINATPQTITNSLHTDSCGKNPFEELQSIIEQERKRIDYACQGGEKLLSSIEKECKQRSCNIPDKGLKHGNVDCDNKKLPRDDNSNERKPSICNNNNNNISEKECKSYKNIGSSNLCPKKCASRIQNPLSEAEATKLLDEMIDTTIKGFNKIAKSLKTHNQDCQKLGNGSTLSCSELEKLKKNQEATEQKMVCLRTSVHEMLVNMSTLLSAKVDIPEIQEMAKELKEPDCSNTK